MRADRKVIDKIVDGLRFYSWRVKTRRLRTRAEAERYPFLLLNPTAQQIHAAS